MKAYTTEELNKELDKPCWVDEKLARVNREKMIGWMIANGHRKQDKPFGKPNKWTDGTVIYFVTDNTGFGFNHLGEWVNLLPVVDLSDNRWQPYPQEKWQAMLLEYAKSRGYKNGNYKCLYKPDETEKINQGKFYINCGNVWHIDHFNNENKIFDGKTGEWAEIIEVEEPKYTHAEWCEKMKQVKLC